MQFRLSTSSQQPLVIKIMSIKMETSDKEIEAEKVKDVLSERIGSFGRWQILIFMVVIVPVKITAYTMSLGIVFLAPLTVFRCEDRNSTDIIKNSTCYSDCTKYEYFSQFDNTIISEWDLVCDRAWLANLVQTLNMCGILLGSLVFGYFSDRCGRRPATIAACMLQLVSSFATACCSAFWAFALMRFILGIATAGNILCTFVILTEVTGAAHRELATSLFQIPLAVGEIALPIFGYYLRSWNTFSLGIAVPTLTYLSYFFILPESPKWLISVGRVQDASAIMSNAAKFNRLPEKDMLTTAKTIANESKVDDPKNQATYLNLIFHPRLRMRNLYSCISWLLLGVTFYGCSQYVGQTSSNVFITMTVVGVLKIPILLVTGYLYKLYGRRRTVAGALALSTICCSMMVVPEDWFYTRLIAGTLGANFVSAAFTAMYVFTTELFPTVVRNMAMGASSTASRVGSALAPFIVGLSAQSLWIPPAAFAVTCIINIGVCFLLPETKGKKMTNTLFETD